MRKDPLLRRTGISAVAQVTQSLRGLFPLLVGRLAGAPVLGVVSVAWSWVDLISKFATWGLDQATTIAVAVAGAGVAGPVAGSGRAILGRAVGRGVARALLLAVLTSVVIRLLYPAGIPARSLMLLVWVLPFVVLFRIANGASWGLGFLHHSILSKGLTEAGVTVGVFVALHVAGFGWRAPILAILCGYAAAAGVAWLLVTRALEHETAAAEMRPQDTLRRARWIGASDLVYMANMRLDVLALGVFVARGEAGLTLAIVGAYAAAVEIGFATKKVRSVFEPIFLRDLAAGSLEEAQRARIWQITVQGAVFGALWLGMPLILALFGPEFGVAVPWARLLLLANVLNGFLSTDSAMNVLAPATNVGVGAAGLALNVLLDVLLIPRYGAAGAAVATTAAFGLQSALRLRALEGTRLPLPRRRLVSVLVRCLMLLVPLAWFGSPATPDPLQTAAVTVLYIVLYGCWTVVAAGLPEVRQAIRGWRGE